MKTQVILLLLLVLNFTACSNADSSPEEKAASQASAATIVKLPQVGMQMEIPSAWKKGGVSGESVLASYDAGSGLYPNMNVTLEPSGGKDLKGFFQQWLNLLTSAQVNSAEPTNINGMPALICDVVWTSPMGPLRALRAIVPVGDKMLVITFVAKTEHLSAASAKEYARSIQSLRKS